MTASSVKAPKVVQGGDADDTLFGGGRADTIVGNAGNDQMFGGGGKDNMAGGEGNDVMFGDAGRSGIAKMSSLKIAESVTGTVAFQGETAGFKNALGVYKIAADGTIYDVDVIWGNASLKGSGGDLVSGKSSERLALNAGDRVGFFIVPDAFSQKGMAALLNDAKASWKMVDAKGRPGNVDGGTELKLVHVDAKGKATDIKSTYGNSVFHSVDDGSKGLNGDKLNHVKTTVDTATGKLTIGFEDLKGGGDKDFDDSVFTLDIGTTNAALTAKVATKPVSGEKHDVMEGGSGDDKMFGMSGNDTMAGGSGHDKMWGNSGNDVMNGDSGNDTMSGGAGNDTMTGGDGDDVLNGNTGDDTFLASAGNDHYTGGEGFDTLDYSRAGKGIDADLSKHSVVGESKDEVWSVEKLVGTSFDDVMKGDKHANVLVGGDGDDVLRGMAGADTLTGGAGRDTFQWQAKDFVDGKGKSLGVDVVTDFSKEDVLDLSKLFKGASAKDAGDLVKVVEDGKSSHVWANLDGNWHQVVTLEGVTGMHAQQMADAGMILV